jgi:hypothetical protein
MTTPNSIGLRSGVLQPPGTAFDQANPVFDGPVTFTSNSSLTVDGNMVVNGTYNVPSLTLNQPTVNGGTITNSAFNSGITLAPGSSVSYNGAISTGTNGVVAEAFGAGGPAATEAQIVLGGACPPGSTITSVSGHDLGGSFTIRATSASGTPGGAIFTFTFSSPMPSVPKAIYLSSFDLSSNTSYVSSIFDSTRSIVSTTGYTLDSINGGFFGSGRLWSFYYMVLF